MKRNTPSNFGFTLIELIVSVALLLLLTGGFLASYNSYNQNQQLKQTALTLKANLRLAQSRALSALKPTDCITPTVRELVGYTVSFTATTYSIQAQCIGGLYGSTTDVSLPAAISFLPTPSPVVFGVLTRGLANTDSPVTLTLVGFGKKYQMVVSPNGDMTDVGFQP